MNPNTRLLAGVAAGVLLGAAVGGAGMWAMQRDRVAALEAKVAESDRADDRSDEVAALQAALDERDRVNESLAERVNELTSRLEATPKKPTSPTTEKQFAYIRTLIVGPPARMTADYAQFLEGKAAADAAEKAGDESPPPNDYYILNENPRLRTLKVSPGATVTLTTKPGEGFNVDGYASTLKQLAEYLADDGEETASLRSNGFWLTIEGGAVVAIAEQYTP